jgi:CheY-like chemotaxis protein
MERILVVDDEIEVCNVLKEFFDSKGYETHIALSGRAALSKVKAVKPRIVLLDIIMPGMGGIDVLKEIKKLIPQWGL